MRENAEMIANLDRTVPLIADADTGYGGPNMVARTVAAYERSGVAGLHIEDQIQTKVSFEGIGRRQGVARHTILTLRAAVWSSRWEGAREHRNVHAESHGRGSSSGEVGVGHCYHCAHGCVADG